jgi:hypothetical protein
MKIIYNQNPLRSVVELDEHDREVFRLKIKIEEMQERLFSAHFSLTEGEFFDLDRARYACNPEHYIQEDNEEKVKLDKRVDDLFNWYMKELQGWHSGDCTCVACSCAKCRAEEILGVDTLKPFPGKQVLAKVESAFLYTENGKSKERSLDEALAYLKNYKVSRTKPDGWRTTQEEYEKHIPRWEDEARRAYEYLQVYAGIYLVQKAILE